MTRESMRPHLLLAGLALALRIGSTPVPAADGVTAGDQQSAVGAPVRFELARPGRASLAVYTADGAVQLRALLVGERLAAGTHTAWWDGLDRHGRALAPGTYQWKLLVSPGIRAEFLDALGTRPKGGPWARWIGNHTGPAAIAVSPRGIVVGAPIAEGPPHIHMFETDFATTRWLAPHYGWSSIGHRVLALTDTAVVSLAQDARVALFDIDSGTRLRGFDVLWTGDERPDHDGGRDLHLDALGTQFAVAYRHHDAVRWFDLETGRVVRQVDIPQPQAVALCADGRAYVLAEPGVVRVETDDRLTVVVPARKMVRPAALAWDAATRTLLVANGAPDHRILRFSARGWRRARYGREGGRQPGPYRADSFAQVTALEADGQGGFFVVEGGDAGGGLRRIAHLDRRGTVVEEHFGGAPFFSAAAAVPGDPHSVYYSPCPEWIGRYELDPATGRSRLTHLLRNRTWGFPGFDAFPHYRPVVRRGQVYLELQGRFILKPDLESGELLPVALADHRPWHGWPTVPEPIARAAAHHGIDPQSESADAFTWSDTNGNARLDPEEFRFHHTAPKPGYAALDADFNVIFGHYAAWNHSYDTVNRRWMGFDWQNALYATLPNAAPETDTPVWDWAQLVLAEARMPDDPLGRVGSAVAVHRAADGRVHFLFSHGGGTHADTHPHPWPVAQVAGAHLVSADAARVLQVAGKHASEGTPRDAQFGQPSHLLGTVDGNLIVCDRYVYTTAWTADGLFIGSLLENAANGERPALPIGLAGDDWMSAGSIVDLGNGEALWFAPGGGDRAMIFRLSGFREMERRSGPVELAAAPPAAALDGTGLRARYFASPELAGVPLVERLDPRLWFYDQSKGGDIVAAWAADGPCPGIPAGRPFGARWTGSFTAPFSEPFWLRIYNTRPGHGHTPTQQAWQNGKGFVRVWVNGHLVLDKGRTAPETNPWQTPPLPLQAGERYDLEVEYASPGDGDAQFSLAWCSRTLEWMRVPTPYLHPEAAPARPRLSVAAVQPLAHEADGCPGLVRFTLDNPLARDLPVACRIGGTAVAADYRLESEPVVIRAGATAAELTVRPLEDVAVEAHETVIVNVLPSVHYAGDGTMGEATVTVMDNDNVLVDDSLAVYYTFDNLGAPGTSDLTDIRNEAGAHHALRVQAYMRTLPQLGPGLPNHGGALFFPAGREDVRAEGHLAPGDFTIAFWFRSPRPTVGLCHAGGVNVALCDGRLQASFSGWPVAQAEGGGLADDQWHHVALAWNREKRQQSLFVDGRWVADAAGAERAAFGSVIQLGRDNAGGALVGGAMDEFRIYTRRLDRDEIQKLAGVRPANTEP